MTINTVSNRQRLARILLVEDNHGDVILTRRAFKEAKIANEVRVAATGEEALDILRQPDGGDTGYVPDLILLDLNLPLMSGQEVLKVIKSDETLKRIPVVIMSSSRAERDVALSYNLHANGYVVKPVSLENFNEAVQKLEDFWFTLVVMPDDAGLPRP